jgi:hypothetical protein
LYPTYVDSILSLSSPLSSSNVTIHHSSTPYLLHHLFVGTYQLAQYFSSTGSEKVPHDTPTLTAAS